MNIETTSLADVLLLEPSVFQDKRGLLFESFNQKLFDIAIGASTGMPRFVQDNHSRSAPHVLRGLHYQIHHPQGKLVRVIAGEVFDVAVDIRRSSSTFGKWVGTTLSSDNMRQMWIPPGFAHGFLVTQGPAEVLYKTTEYWMPQAERCIFWNDPAIGIKWPVTRSPLLSDKDLHGSLLLNAEVFA
jgi:dTDP-4-dehydrorhamnose 3,5-epimerase